MPELLTAAQMRALEQAAIGSGAVTGLDLMERAGCGVVNAVVSHWPELARAPHRAVVLCGPGNNGGDGFVVARLLAERGWKVEAVLWGDPGELPPDAKTNYQRWQAIGATHLRSFVEQDEEDSAPAAGPVDLLVDGLFGTGLTRPFVGLAALDPALDTVLRQGEPRRVAIDLPSGLCSDSGRVLGAALEADLTVSFHSAKLGHVLAEGPGYCGALHVVSIGLEGADQAAMTSGDVVAQVGPGCLARLSKAASSHKYAHGHALVLSGGAGRSGAARLAARGALRVGAGLVTLGAPGSAQMEIACQIAALMLARVDEADALALLLSDPRLNALCLGPGLGLERARALVPVALEAKRQVVLDADALTAFEADPEALFDGVHPHCVLTPHAGEFARLFPDLADRLAAPPQTGPAFSKVDATRAAAARAGCVVLFKGPDTVIAAPDARCAVHAAQYENAAPWLATAGSGDVLAGFLTGLMARGLPAFEAAQTAAWLHVECARAFGPGLIAEDLPEQVPHLLRAAGL
jgi:hydroxyethylthiazole kinase-like uncharacterized protein yjeF